MTAKKAKPRAKPHPHLVLLHGLGGSAADWDEVARHLGKRFDVLALDLPGTGKTPTKADRYDPTSLARFVRSALEERGITRAFFAGHSLGGRVAGELAAMEPERVGRLALIAPLGAAPYSLAEKLKWKAMSRRVLLESVPESSMRSAAGYGFAMEGAAKKAFVERALAGRTGPFAGDVFLAVERSVDGVLDAPPLTERLRGTKFPLLVVVGAEDPLVPPDTARTLLQTRRDATFVELPRVGHYAPLEDPERLAATLRDFFG